MGLNFKKLLSYLKSAPTKLSKCKIWWKNEIVYIWDKNVLFGYFATRILKNYYHIWNQDPRICQVAIFCEKIKMLKFGTKNVLFGYFEATILKSYCHISNQHPRICQTTKFREKIKVSKFETKKSLFGYFWARTFKN